MKALATTRCASLPDRPLPRPIMPLFAEGWQRARVQEKHAIHRKGSSSKSDDHENDEDSECKAAFLSLDGNLDRVNVHCALVGCDMNAEDPVNANTPCPSPPLVASSLEDLSDICKDDKCFQKCVIETDADDQNAEHGAGYNDPYNPTPPTRFPNAPASYYQGHFRQYQPPEPQSDIYLARPSKFNAEESIQVRRRLDPHPHSFPIPYPQGQGRFIVMQQHIERYEPGMFTGTNGSLHAGSQRMAPGHYRMYSPSAESLAPAGHANRVYYPSSATPGLSHEGHTGPYQPSGVSGNMAYSVPEDQYYDNTVQYNNQYPSGHDSGVLDSPDRLYMPPSRQVPDEDGVHMHRGLNSAGYPSYHQLPVEHNPTMSSGNDDMYYMHPEMARAYFIDNQVSRRPSHSPMYLPEHVVTRSLPPDFKDPYFSQYYPEVLYQGRYGGSISPPSSTEADSYDMCPPCSVPGCSRPVINKGTDGMCLEHYRRQIYEEVRLANRDQVPPNVTCDLPTCKEGGFCC